jgi:hypothetical protein
LILVCAATGTEAAACRAGIRDAGARDFSVLTTGVGPERAAGALARWFAERSGGGAPALVVSSGFAGALTAGLDPLSWVTASSVHRLVDGRAVRVAVPPGLLRVAQDAVRCSCVSADRVLAGPVPEFPAPIPEFPAGIPEFGESARVPELGEPDFGQPAVADMESAALAEVAAAAGIPLLVLRMVTDTPTRPLSKIGHSLAMAMEARGAGARATLGTRAALDAARSPLATLRFVRSGLLWRSRLREGWREHAKRGLPMR